jgi:hypothetical protein
MTSDYVAGDFEQPVNRKQHDRRRFDQIDHYLAHLVFSDKFIMNYLYYKHSFFEPAVNSVLLDSGRKVKLEPTNPAVKIKSRRSTQPKRLISVS